MDCYFNMLLKCFISVEIHRCQRMCWLSNLGSGWCLMFQFCFSKSCVSKPSSTFLPSSQKQIDLLRIGHCFGPTFPFHRTISHGEQILWFIIFLRVLFPLECMLLDKVKACWSISSINRNKPLHLLKRNLNFHL